MAKEVSPGVKALRKVVDDVHADARQAAKEGKLVGWSSSKFPCELAEAFGLNVMYPENQAAGIAANRDGEIMCQAAEDLGFDNDICGYARISLAYAAGKRASASLINAANTGIVVPVFALKFPHALQTLPLLFISLDLSLVSSDQFLYTAPFIFRILLK